MNLKQLFIKIMCVMMSTAILLCTAGCGKEEKTKKKKIIKKVIVTEEEQVSDIPSDVNSSDIDGDADIDDNEGAETDTSSVRRELYVAETEEHTETYEPEYKSTISSWNGPKNYVIIYSDSCPYSYNSARNLQNYFLNNAGVKLEIKKDTETIEQDKEILVGNSNRYTSKLEENKFAVTLKGEKLVFEGGHYAMVEKAADWFMTEKYKSGSVTLLSGTAQDFTSAKAGGYKYVWGDEFDGNGLDYYKWDDEIEPGTPPQSVVNLSGKEAVEAGAQNVEDGRLKLRSVRYFTQTNTDAQYGVGRINTTGKFAYLYGYAEIRARVPLRHGAWASWWMRSGWCPPMWEKTSGPNGNPFTYNEAPYIVEFDIFECFSSESIIPNIHKWWNNAVGFDIPTKHNEYPLERNSYSFEPATAPYEYHVYGCTWTPEKMAVSIDGKDYMTFDLKNGFNKYGEREYNGYMGQPMNFILACNLFTSDLTAMDPSGKIIRNEDLPLDFFVDYIRVYQRDSDKGGYWALNP